MGNWVAAGPQHPHARSSEPSTHVPDMSVGIVLGEETRANWPARKPPCTWLPFLLYLEPAPLSSGTDLRAPPAPPAPAPDLEPLGVAEGSQ